ncbi:P-loop NTPase [candidate division KSB1 bacterium]|nr:P-loop NTPase [candidate division KSB1 bacterium]
MVKDEELHVSKEEEKQRRQTLDQVLEDVQLDQQLAEIKHKIIVLSGKGGVGKSTVSANLALSLALAGKEVGLLDIDFHGPSIPKLMGLEGKRAGIEADRIVPITFAGKLKVMSLGLLLQGEDDAVIWRGPMKMGAIKQLIKDVAWGRLDYLIVDSPPGTGDEPLSIVQLLKNPTGAVVVTQPQDLSTADVRRSIVFCRQLKLPVLGVIENMSGFVCPKCGETVDIFKSGGGESMAEKMNVPFLGRIPIEPAIVAGGDSGEPFVYFRGKSETAIKFTQMAEKLIHSIEDKADDDDKEADSKKEEKEPMAESVCRYAVPTANGELCLHFGHCDQFAIIDVDLNTKQVVQSQLQTPPPHEPGVLPKWLHSQNVHIILAGGMGQRAQSLFTQNGIQVVVGATAGKPEDIVLAHVRGALATGENICDH